MGAVAGIVGAGGNVGAVLAGFLFKSETISYRESLFIIGVIVIAVSVAAMVLSLSRRTAEEIFHPEVRGEDLQPATIRHKLVMKS